ncbi:MAG TPA: cystathionine gamma-lyase [Acidobacteriaceae bacterium]|jgi:cystathionine gamma-lyase|nr:cystathionine gamma-lyase [Acidobacteriaceae bacterium]
MDKTTQLVRAGLPIPPKKHAPGAAIHPGPVFASSFAAPGDPANSSHTYGRFHNPTWSELESALGTLEGGIARIFPSGMAAVTAVFAALLQPGDTVVLPDDCYYTTRLLTREFFATLGIHTRLAPTRNNAQGEVLAGAKLLWLETPSNPMLDLCDIAALSEAAHRHGALVAVDNTTPTALGQSPLALGANISVASDTKSLAGHSDLILGHVAVRDAALAAKIERWRTLSGSIVGPMEAWLALRSLSTLPLRLERQSQNAQAIAEFLTQRPEVTKVYYPGLPSHPAHALARQQMRYYGPVVSFELAGKQAAERFLAASRLLVEATSFGGTVSSAERRARWAADNVSEGFIRMSAGCESIKDLLTDLTQALQASQIG